MAFELHQRTHIEKELRRIVRRQLRNAIRSLTTSDGTALRSAIHQSRRSVKKVRSVTTFLDQVGAEVPRKDRKRLKATSQALSRLRDSAAIIDTFDRLRQHHRKHLPAHAYGILRQALADARDRQEAHAQRDIGDVVKRLRASRASAKAWASSSIELSDAIAVIAASYRRSRQAMRRARTTGQSATVHRWRKELKTLWYHLRLVKPLSPGVSSFVSDINRLQTQLGDDHDLVVLGATLKSHRAVRSMRREIRQVDRFAARMRQVLRRRAFALGRRLHARSPKAFARWLRESCKPARTKHPAAA